MEEGAARRPSRVRRASHELLGHSSRRRPFHITTGAHIVITNQPTEDGGSDAGMMPVELFSESLCVGYSVASYCASSDAFVEMVSRNMDGIC
jgi:hypothetical protein